MGYGFVEFKKTQNAKDALKKLQVVLCCVILIDKLMVVIWMCSLKGCHVDGHSLELKFSHRTSKYTGCYDQYHVRSLTYNISRLVEGIPSKKTRKRKQTSAKLLIRNVPFEATINELRQILRYQEGSV